MAETFQRTSLAVTSTEQDVYTCPNATQAIVLSCLIANVDGTNSDDITANITTSANNPLSRIASTITVPADASLELIANKLVLEAGEKLRLTGAAASGRLSATVSILEIS
jgi:hypothetical protein